jgi:hypothetical protein
MKLLLRFGSVPQAATESPERPAISIDHLFAAR